MREPYPRKITAVVFDLDGTLIHSAPDIAAHLNAVLVEEGQAPFSEHEVRRFIGCGAQRLVMDAFAARNHALLPDAVERLTARYLEIYRRHGSPRTTPYPHAKDVLAALHGAGIQIAVCTNKPEAISAAVLAELGLAGDLQAIIGGDSGFGRKPNPGPVEESCRRLGAKPENTLLVGDTAIDVGAGRSAGLGVVLMRHGYSQILVDGLGADAILETLADLPPIVSLPAVTTTSLRNGVGE